MGLHPTGPDVIADAAGGGRNTLVTGVHALALAAQPLMLLGTLGLTLRLAAQRELAASAYACYALATFAIVIAAVASGFIAPSVLSHYAGATGPARDAMAGAFHYTGIINRAFARVSVGFVALAILLWSAAMLRGGELARGVALYGLALGTVLLVALLAGRLSLDVHGFGAVVLGQAIWMTWTGVLLRR
jgi:hypothetical protein